MDGNSSIDEDDYLLSELSSSFVEQDELELIEKSKTLQDGNEPHEVHLEVLQRCFGHKSFRPMQWKIINSIINDCQDNCVVMATGYGKSLCYQYPSVFCGGVTLVISPLISLMEDQVLSLAMTNISACLLGSAQAEQKKVIGEILEGKYSLVYLTPEFCCGDYGVQLLRDINERQAIMLIAVDEAHCVSTWGHDFRFQYRQLGMLKALLPHIPILAVTATATPRVRDDIISSLQLKNPQILCSGFDRPNLHFSVLVKGNMGILSDLRKVMVKQNGQWTFTGSTIVYCITRKQTEDVAELLKVSGVNCEIYHAGLTVKQRKRAHEKFVRDKVDAIVATIAFGMGIDKPDVRNIIHYGAPRDIESYYQEVGRAGRDGQPARCVVIYNSGDFIVHRNLREMSYGSDKSKKQKEASERQMQTYLELKTCRRQFILNHFERQSLSNNQTRKTCCDNCDKKIYQVIPDKYEDLNEQGLYDFTEDSHTFLAAVKAMGGRYGVSNYILFLRGSKSSKLFDRFKNHALHGSGKHKSEEWWKCIGHVLQREKYLESRMLKRERQFSCSTIHLTSKGERFLNSVINEPRSTKILLDPTPEMLKLLKRKLPQGPAVTWIQPASHRGPVLPNLLQKESNAKAVSVGEVESETQKQERMHLYRLLMNRRTEIASRLDCMPYMIASNEALMKMAQLKPRNVDAFRKCQLDGFTEAKIMRFGDEFIKVILVTSPSEESVVLENHVSFPLVKKVLLENPLPGVKFTDSMEWSYRLYKSGLSIQEIAKQRGLAESTVISHLSDCIKFGKPVKLADLTVTEKVRSTITSFTAIQSAPITSNKILTEIKNRCPEEITFGQICAVTAFLQVCDHLAKFNCDYEGFRSVMIGEKDTGGGNLNNATIEIKDNEGDEHEDFNNAMVESNDNETNESDSDGETNEMIDALNALVDEIERNGYLDETFVETTAGSDVKQSDDVGVIILEDDKVTVKKEINDAPVSEPPGKKKKFSRLSLLDSPPRRIV